MLIRTQTMAKTTQKQSVINQPFSLPCRLLHAFTGRPDESTPERLDGDPGAEHRVPLAALRGRAGVRGGLCGGRGARAPHRPAGPARGHPAAGAPLQEAPRGEGGVCHPQGHRPR